MVLDMGGWLAIAWLLLLAIVKAHDGLNLCVIGDRIGNNPAFHHLMYNLQGTKAGNLSMVMKVLS